jgi:hypothetical protein
MFFSLLTLLLSFPLFPSGTNERMVCRLRPLSFWNTWGSKSGSLVVPNQDGKWEASLRVWEIGDGASAWKMHCKSTSSCSLLIRVLGQQLVGYCGSTLHAPLEYNPHFSILWLDRSPRSASGRCDWSLESGKQDETRPMTRHDASRLNLQPRPSYQEYEERAWDEFVWAAAFKDYVDSRGLIAQDL